MTQETEPLTAQGGWYCIQMNRFEHAENLYHPTGIRERDLPITLDKLLP